MCDIDGSENLLEMRKVSGWGISVLDCLARSRTASCPRVITETVVLAIEAEFNA